ncbi:50S ribosomal protein L32 [Candidatus Roizmanbacteria bacterium CG_4_9_14_0_2_um_filter_36_12]|uniref:Large ribosomal subunit protein bL32 n=1 Tax=Candidatus Roizmanbacteria bacterium CG_4_9_14_0_2_um_filter_36_12 TaxID=1974837 RepID=A0A2M8F2W8_9BACT|nr:MAG: 50S ribosomal protein L32 [Candidatus Roizmanbacteria bacterium CG_4_9_14_0_2_um_filter_36_12]
MAPLPKRKHSTRRSGKRKAAKMKSLPNLVKCSSCSKTKLPHRICKYCGK